MKMLVAFALLIQTAAASAADQFDLVCKGHRTVHYRVDLASTAMVLVTTVRTSRDIDKVDERKITFEIAGHPIRESLELGRPHNRRVVPGQQ